MSRKATYVTYQHLLGATSEIEWKVETKFQYTLLLSLKSSDRSFDPCPAIISGWLLYATAVPSTLLKCQQPLLSASKVPSRPDLRRTTRYVRHASWLTQPVWLQNAQIANEVFRIIGSAFRNQIQSGDLVSINRDPMIYMIDSQLKRHTCCRGRNIDPHKDIGVGD